jgi:hypothetical protein
VRVSDRVAVTLRRGRPTIRPQVTCPAASAGGCTGTLTITARVRTASGRLTATLGRGRFEIAAGGRERVTVRLPRALGRLIGTGTRRATAVSVSRDAAGNLADRSESITLVRVRR